MYYIRKDGELLTEHSLLPAVKNFFFLLANTQFKKSL